MVYSKLDREGIVRPELREGMELLPGFLFANSSGGYIFVRGEDSLPRRRFTAAHELGHYLLHYLPMLERADAQATEWLHADGDETVWKAEKAEAPDAPTLPEMERQANRFAAELLMPAEVCRRWYDYHAAKYGPTPQFIEHMLAGDLLVSREAARWRLRELGLLR